MGLNIGIQLYTLRDELSKGYDLVFSTIAESGYKGVEMLYLPDKGDEMADLLKKYSLVATGAHIGIDAIEKNFDVVVGFLGKIKSNKCIIPHISHEMIKDYESCAAFSERMEAAAKKLAAENIELGFHNHVIEFEKSIDGKTPIDVFFEVAPSLKFEMDIGWACAAGADIMGYIKKLGDRLQVVHIKDVDDKNTPTEIGNGRVDFKSILPELKVEWGIVEQDSCVNYPAFESVKISRDYLRSIGY